MPLAQLPLTGRPHRNQQLFSDHYLDVVLPMLPQWQSQRENAVRLLAEVQRIFADFVPSTNEAQTEHEFIRPVLEALGHTFEVQPALHTPGNVKRPDYIFYRDAAALAANKNTVLNDANLSGALAVGEVKYWERPLDRAITTGDPFDNKNPGYQISFYMQHTGLPWGILTNGRIWRLYHKETAHKLDRFYEVDLVALLEAESPAAFQYFSAFFAREAFDAGPLSLAELLAASASFTQAISNDLKQQVYDALRHVAQGFLDSPDNRLDTEPATLQQIHDNALILLYRLLFILYAEARGLLPLGTDETYRRSYSLEAIKRDTARELDQGRPLLPGSRLLWPRLTEPFRIIDRGEPVLHVSTFDGGLFDPRRHPFLDRYSVGDAHLRRAIDKLARVGGEFIDYRDLAERHLGTIYEGLLEFRLQPLIERSGGWSVDLVTSKGERKISGSFFTPGFITRYMVEQTIGPVVDRALTDSAGSGPDAQAQAVLALDVLDCAMGSGHFLVEATEYIARRLVEANLLPSALRAPAGAVSFDELSYWKRRVAQSCVYGVDLNPLAVDLAKLSLWLITAAQDHPLSFLDHHLRPGNALAGAWLSDLGASAGSQAERRRRQAATKLEAAQTAGQMTMFEDDAFRRSVGIAVDSMWLIEENPAATVADVKAQESAYEGLRRELIDRYKRMADLSTAVRFGLEVDQRLWQPLVDYANGRTLAASPYFDGWLQQADETAGRWRFFHWELEFPEVFFDRRGGSLGSRAGFDVVIGNPPYVRQEEIAPLKPYLASAYPETYHGVADLYVYFYHQGLRLTRSGGRMSYIVTNKWLRAGYGEPLRAYFAKQGALEQIIDFGHAPIFPDADVFPCIIVLEKPIAASTDVPAPDHQVQVTSFPRAELHRVEIGRYVADHAHAVPHSRFGRAAWNLEPNAVDDLLAKIRRNGEPLAEFAGVKPYRGVLTGLNEAFLIDTPTRNRLVAADRKCAEIIKPCLRGQDMKRWSPEWQELWMIVLKSSENHSWPWATADDAAEEVFHQTYPSLWDHMKRLEPALRKRLDHGVHWWELRTCAYYDAFERRKIMYQEIQTYPWYSLDNTGYLTNNKCFILPVNDLYILAVLNSPLVWWHNWRYLPHMINDTLTPLGVLMEQLPIAPASDETRQAVEPAVARLIEITKSNQQARADMLDWLRTEFSVETPGQKLEAFAALDADAFVEEVRKRRPRVPGRLGPGALSELRAGYYEQATPVQQRRSEARELERRLSDLVNQAYGLTPEEVELLWATAPPRMPLTE